MLTFLQDRGLMALIIGFMMITSKFGYWPTRPIEWGIRISDGKVFSELMVNQSMFLPSSWLILFTMGSLTGLSIWHL